MHRFYLRISAVLAGLIFCVPLHYLWKLLRLRSIWPQVFLGFAGRCAGVRVRIVGRPLQSSALFAANHVSWLDILCLGGASRAQFVAKDEVERWPAIGWLADINETIYIARHARGTVQHQADRLRDALEEGRCVGLFPEGTTEGAHETLPFRASLFASLYPPLPGVKVQPVALDYGDALAEVAWIGDEPFGPNARRILSRPGTFSLVIHFLEPIDPEESGDRKVLAARSHDAVVAVLAASGGAADPL